MVTPSSRDHQSPPAPAPRQSRLAAALKYDAAVLVTAGIVFLPAGRLDWVMGWVFLILFMGGSSALAWYLERTNPALRAERAALKPQAGAKRWDAILVNLYASMLLVTLVLSGLDERFDWSHDLSTAVQLLAMAGVFLSSGLIVWAMLCNRFFTGYVRIQQERGHTVATSGPYRWVRHPSYTGMILVALTLPLMLGSVWALVSGGLAAGLMALRTALEDRTLQQELPGYQDYARQIRYRLLPGIW